MLEIFALWTIWFWVLSLAGFILVTAFVENGYPGRATFSVLVFFTIMYFLGGLNALSWLYNNPGTFFGYLLLYFVVGTIYCVVKWYFFLLNIRDGSSNEYFAGQWHSGNPPSPFYFKSRLVGWIIYWPFSGLWTIINDPVRRIAQGIYSHIETLLQKISNSVFKDVKKEK
jgi:hypothetical protein